MLLSEQDGDGDDDDDDDGDDVGGKIGGDGGCPYGTANSVTFKTLIVVFGRLIPQGARRRRFVSVAFERCCREGWVDGTVLRALERYAPELCEKLPKGKLPRDWSRNVRRGGKGGKGGGRRNDVDR